MNSPHCEVTVLPGSDPVLLVEELDTVQARLWTIEHQLTLLHDLPEPGAGVPPPHRDAPLPGPAVNAGDLVLVSKERLHVCPAQNILNTNTPLPLSDLSSTLQILTLRSQLEL